MKKAKANKKAAKRGATNVKHDGRKARDLPASEMGWHLANLVSSLVEAGVIHRNSPQQMALNTLNFERMCHDALSRYVFNDLRKNPSASGQTVSHISANALVKLAAALTKAKLISAADCAGDLAKLADKALEFCDACGLVVMQRNLYCMKERERKSEWGLLLAPFHASGRVPLELVLEWAGLNNSTLVNEYKAEGIEKDWFSMSDAQKREEMFRYLAREPVELQWTDLPTETGLAHEWSRKESVGNDDQIKEMIAMGVPCELVPRVVELLKIAKKKKESDQKRRAALAVQEKKRKL